jgi:hypothetical protein
MASASEATSQEGTHSLPAVLYAAKSTEDLHGSIPTQLEDGQRLADQRGWTIADPSFQDEGFSAFSGNRGPGLEAAKARAADLGAKHGRCFLVAQHSDRFARGAGDAPDAADHLAEVYFWASRAKVTLWTVQEGEIDSIHALLSGIRNTEDSARKSKATRDGLRRRKERGEPVGALNYGYQPTLVGEDAQGRAITKRMPFPEQAAVVRRAFDLLDAYHQTGEIGRIFNSEAIPSKRGGKWTNRAVARMLRNRNYIGEGGYPAIIERDQFERVQRILDQRANGPRGGRKPNTFHLLLGIARCFKCGDPLYVKPYAAGPHYLCRAVKEGHGTCDAARIPAEVAEQAVLEHLDTFLGKTEAWLAEQAKQKNDDRARFAELLAGQERELARLLRRVGRAQAAYNAALDGDDDSLVATALRALERAEANHADLADAITEGRQRLANWPAPDIDDALDFYKRLQEQITGKVQAADDAESLRRALNSVLASAFLDVIDGWLQAHFELRPESSPGPVRSLWLGIDLQDGSVFRSSLITQEEMSEMDRRRSCT